MISKVLQKLGRGRTVGASVQKHRFEDLPFTYSFDNLVRAYDLRMWYIQNSPHDGKSIQYVQELEKIHNELNYLNLRAMSTRYFAFIVALYTFYAFYEMPLSYDWQNMYEPKHEQSLYGDLIEGGEEGDDD